MAVAGSAMAAQHKAPASAAGLVKNTGIHFNGLTHGVNNPGKTVKKSMLPVLSEDWGTTTVYVAAGSFHPLDTHSGNCSGTCTLEIHGLLEAEATDASAIFDAIELAPVVNGVYANGAYYWTYTRASNYWDNLSYADNASVSGSWTGTDYVLSYYPFEYGHYQTDWTQYRD
jgi:hypothetical protein